MEWYISCVYIIKPVVMRLYDIFIDCEMPKKLVKLIKMSMSVISSKVHVIENFPAIF
jgi:hypothetical protein